MPSQSNRHFIVVLIVMVVSGSAVGLLAWSAGHLAHVTTEQSQGLVNDIVDLRSDFTAIEADSLRVAVSRALPVVARESFQTVLARDLGLALFIAVVVTLALEFYARNRLQDEVRDGVFEATLKRLILPEIFDEVHRSVIGARSYRDSWRVEMTLTPGTGLPEGFVACRSVLQYSLRNTTRSSIVETVVAGLDEHVVIGSGSTRLPRIESIQVGSETPCTGAALAKWLSPDGVHLRRQIDVGTAPVTVTVTLREIIRVPDTFTWHTSAIALNPSISIDTTAVPEVTVVVTPLHSDRNRLREDVGGRTWRFEGGMLPWQGFQVRTVREDPTLALGAAPETEAGSRP